MLHCRAMVAVAASLPMPTSCERAWSGLPTPTASHGSRSCGRTCLVSSVSVLRPQAGQSNLNLLQCVAWRFQSAGRDLPCPNPNHICRHPRNQQQARLGASQHLRVHESYTSLVLRFNSKWIDVHLRFI